MQRLQCTERQLVLPVAAVYPHLRYALITVCVRIAPVSHGANISRKDAGGKSEVRGAVRAKYPHAYARYEDGDCGRQV